MYPCSCAPLDVRRCRFIERGPDAAPIPRPDVPGSDMGAWPVVEDRGRVAVIASLGADGPPLRAAELGAPEARFLHCHT